MKTLRLLSLIILLVFALVACGAPAATPADPAQKTITVAITGKTGTTETLTLQTAAETLEEALREQKLIEGEQGQYGLYVTAVKGEVADYDKDHAYWAFSKAGEPLLTGVSGESIANGDRYEIVYTVVE